jgi:hypothetical protein
MIEEIDTNKVRDFLEKSSSRQPNSAGALPENDADVSQVNYASLIDDAMQSPQTDTRESFCCPVNLRVRKGSEKPQNTS